ncbi:hypothetical protein Pfo_015324 [Paulownia fortunei]|nr:hypothetical protein Pfo_015324 [Paulownia fortunei]
MEHYNTTHYLMWMKSKHILSSTKSPYSSMNSFTSPWDQEQPSSAFQEPLVGGFIWPPRSYTCTFCRREFRSAQALGGHMNVHRRDRARLKQSSPPQQPEPGILHHQKHTSHSSDQEPVRFPAPESLSGRRSLQVPPIIFTSLCKPFMNSEEIPSFSDLKSASTEENTRRSRKPALRADECNDEDFVETKLSVGLDLVDRGTVICKRHKKSSGVSPLPFFHSKLCSSERCGASPMEDIDLELRLGDPPAVK